MKRNLKIVSGLVLFVFVGLHLSNLALGVFSLKFADTIRPWLMLPFSNPVISRLLVSIMLLHMALGLQTLYLRNTLRMSRYDSVQFISAFLLPPLLIPHVWGVIATKELLELSPSYLDLFRQFWVHDPLDGLRQVLLVVIIWIHGCIGLFTWLQLKSWWPRYSTIAYPLAVAIPVMALMGYVAGGNHILGAETKSDGKAQAYSSESTAPKPYASSSYKSSSYESSSYESSSYESKPAESTAYGSTAYGSAGTSKSTEAYSYQNPTTEVDSKKQRPPPDTYGETLTSLEVKESIAYIKKTKWQMIIGYCGLLLLVLLARQFRIRNLGGLVEIRYADGRTIIKQAGPTLLDLANINDVPHANLCRGRGRCGTCRVEVLETDCVIEPPSNLESVTLARYGGEANVRLACQLSPGPGIINVRRLLPPNVRPGDLLGNPDSSLLDLTEPPTNSSARRRDL